MWTTPAPPSTAFVAASIWSGTGEVNTSPGHAASSMPSPTNPPCSGSWAQPPPRARATIPPTRPAVQRLVARAAAGDQGDLALHRRARAHDDLRLAVDAQDVAVGRRQARER